MTDRAFLRLARLVSAGAGKEMRRRTEHLQRLPDGLLVEDMRGWVGVGAVFDALHVLWGVRGRFGGEVGTRTCHLDQSELLDPCASSARLCSNQWTYSEDHPRQQKGDIEAGHIVV